MVFESHSAEETFAFGEQLGKVARPGEIYCLEGDLGVGKTVFTQGFARGLGVEDYVNSPTFNIVKEYDGRLRLYHFDVYRIGDPSEMEEIGYEEYFFGQGVCIVEWPSQIPELIPPEARWVRIEKDLERGFDYRRITLEEGKGDSTC